jgi:hypothetical protein
MTRRWIGLILVGGWEMLLGIGLVLGLALVFAVLLLVIFPRGSGLVYLYDELSESGKRTQGLALESSYAQPELVAELAVVQRSVRDRPATAIAWHDAQAGMPLEDRHTIQTLDRSRAEIEMNGGHRLSLGENSLVVLKRPEGRRRASRHASLVLLDGRVQGSVGSGMQGAAPVEFVTLAGASRVEPGAGGQAEFSLTVNPDQTSTLSVYSGSAEVRTDNGIARVDANQAVTISAEAPPAPPVPIPDSPSLLRPANRELVTYGAIAPRVTFSWDEPSRENDYYLEIARDESFTELVFDGQVTGGELVHGNLGAGRYFWRAWSRAGNVESLPSPVRVLDLEQDLDPPGLEIRLPESAPADRPLSVRGLTEPGAELYVGGASVDVDRAGQFDYALNLKPGLNIVAVEAIDAAGNSSYYTHYVTAAGRRP